MKQRKIHSIWPLMVLILSSCGSTDTSSLSKPSSITQGDSSILSNETTSNESSNLPDTASLESTTGSMELASSETASENSNHEENSSQDESTQEVSSSDEEYEESSKDRYETFMNFNDGDYGAWFCGTLMSIEGYNYRYPSIANAFFMDGTYGYYAINIDIENIDFEVGKPYMILGRYDVASNGVHRIDCNDYSSDESVFSLDYEGSEIYYEEPSIIDITDELPNVPSSYYLATINCRNLKVASLEGLSDNGSFSKAYFTATLNNIEYRIDCNGNLIDGSEMISFIQTLKVGTTFNLKNAILLTEKNFRILNCNMIEAID